MNQNKYNRRIRLFFHKFSPPPSIQRETLTSTQLNLSQFDRSKQEVYSGITRRYLSSRKLKPSLNKSWIQAINQSNHHQRDTKMGPIHDLHLACQQRNWNVNSKSSQQFKLKRGNIRQVILIDGDNCKKEDSFPLIHVKKFSIKKVDKRWKKRQTKINQQASIEHNYHSIFQPWQISEQFDDYSRF